MEPLKGITLPDIWNYVYSSYEPIRDIGFGTFGQVVLARFKETGEIFAIKLIRNVFSSKYHCKKVLREIGILRRLSQLSANVYTSKLYDIIIPASQQSELETFNDVFLVMEYVEFDLKSIIESQNPP